jgi:hypothetical protein
MYGHMNVKFIILFVWTDAKLHPEGKREIVFRNRIAKKTLV